MNKEDVFKILSNRKIQWIATILVLFVVLMMSSSIRLSNWELLTDQTTGEKIPLALDPFYFLRLAETLVENGGNYPEVDSMRYPSANIEYSTEILPRVITWMYYAANTFGEYTLREVDVFSPVAFFFVGLILFFLLVYFLTRSKSCALISVSLLAFIPSYLHRTLAGFADHEAIGIMAFLSAILVYVLALKFIDKKKSLIGASLFGLGVAFLSSLTVASWGGVANFIFMIFPFSFFILWLTKSRDDKSFTREGVVFYSLWLFFSSFFGVLFGMGVFDIFKRFVLSTNGLIGLFVLLFILLDHFFMSYFQKKYNLNEKSRVGYLLGGILILGVSFLTIIGKNVFAILSDAWTKLFHPWGVGRVGDTIAENAQPFLLDWINQSGIAIFWMFFGGMLFIGLEISKKIKRRKEKVFFFLFWIVLISGTLFSRISSSSLMNGTNFISQVIYVGSLIVSLGYFSKLYFKEKIDVGPELSFIVSWMFFTLLSGRAAQRMFFAIMPFVVFSAGFFVVKLWGYFKNNRDEVLRPILGIILIISIFGLANSLYSFENSLSAQASATGPSAQYQWQASMSWVRENTPEGAIFIHWWDYGYWVQTLGERPSVTDGGHARGYWDHLIGRYLLTTPYPETAYSIMKSYNVSYLLIDPTDFGKYSAYSKIGSGVDGLDRFSSIPLMNLDSAQTIETANGTIRVYSGGMFVDEDINLAINGEKVFLPAEKSFIGGVIWKSGTDSDGKTGFERPIGVYYYNGQRRDIPLRYIYFEGEILDFGNGLDAVVMIIPSLGSQSIDSLGSSIYLSPKVSKSLFAQIYLMDDVFGNYEDLSLVHTELDVVVQNLKGQGFNFGDFISYQGGLRGPIKIWEVDYPDGTLERKEFLRSSGDWAEFDDLEFVK